MVERCMHVDAYIQCTAQEESTEKRRQEGRTRQLAEIKTERKEEKTKRNGGKKIRNSSVVKYTHLLLSVRMTMTMTGSNRRMDETLSSA